MNGSDEEKKDLIIITQDGKRVNINQEIDNLITLVNQEKPENDVFKQIQYLSSFVTKNTKMKNAIQKLKLILSADGLDSEFIQQLGVITMLIQAEGIEYEPVNENFIDLYDKKKQEVGISLLCDTLNETTGGIHTGKICTIVGGPGSMKTTYATNICYEALKNGKNVCFLSLEETPLDIYSKLLSRVSVDLNKNFTVKDITQHNLPESEIKILKDCVYKHLENQSGTFTLYGESDLGDLSELTLETKLKEIDERLKKISKLKQNQDNHGLDIIIVDHLQMFKYVNSKIKDEHQLINMYVSFFRKQCKNFLGQDREIVVILLSQCNREGITYARNHDGQYLMQHVAEASEIERASSYIISVYTDAMSQVSKLLKIGAVKLRGAALPITTVNVFADGQFYQVGETITPEQASYSYADIEINNTKITRPEGPDLNEILGEFAI